MKFLTVIKKTSTQQWREIGGKKNFYRSIWEANYARYLEFLKKNKDISDWFHEPQVFWFHGISRGVTNYKPDFKVLKKDGSHYWVEVKGYMDPKSVTKLKRFEKYYPQEIMVVIDKKWFCTNNTILSKVISGWENGSFPNTKLQIMRKSSVTRNNI